MNEEKIDVQELIKVESLPKIFYQLEVIGKEIDKNLKGIDKLKCTEENKQEVKRRKQEITAFKNLMEERRKEIKNQIMAKYNEFNEKYEEEVKLKLINAESILTEKYSKIEIQQKQEKEDEVREFAERHFVTNNIEDIVKFEDIGLNITLSASVKSLKEKVLNFCEKISNDLKLIELEEYSDEIMLEYKNNFDFVKSKTIVIEKYKKLEEIQRKREELKKQEEKEKKIIQQNEKLVEEIEVSIPQELNNNDEKVELNNEEEMITVSFKVIGTKKQLKELKDFLKERGIEYA